MQPIPRRLLSVLIILLGFLWLLFSKSEAMVSTGLTFAPNVGFHAPLFSLEVMTGETVSLADYAGTPTILNFWASWCPPCRAEMPALQSVYDQYQGSISILAINAANQDTLVSATGIQTEFGLAFPILMDFTGTTQEDYAISSLPTTFFIGSDGVINKVQIGGPLTEANLRIWIEQMLKGLP
jgi:cytochrome c biogenesis protein CcmG/thiol:disulfide interchange protein DsbE